MADGQYRFAIGLDREAGAIEQDADIVAFIHRPAYYGAEFMESPVGQISTKGVGTIDIAKQRDGSTGEVFFSHNYSMTRIGDYDSVNSETAQSDNDPF